MKNNENKVKKILQGKGISRSRKLFFGSILVSPVAIPTIIKFESGAISALSSFISFGNKSLIIGSGISNWWLIFVCLGLIVSSACEAKGVRDKKKESK